MHTYVATNFLQVSVTLSSALCNGTATGQWLVSFLIDKSISNLSVWSSDQSVADSSVELLSSMAKNSSAAIVAMDNNMLWSMMRSFVTNQAPLNQLPCAVQRKLMCNLILLATGSKKELFLTQVNKIIINVVYMYSAIESVCMYVHAYTYIRTYVHYYLIHKTKCW